MATEKTSLPNPKVHAPSVAAVSSQIVNQQTSLPGHLVRLPGTNWAVWRWIVLRGAGFPANEVFKTRNTPKVIGGATPACLEVTRALYSHIIDTLVPVSSTETAEMVKLLENTFRAVNIGLANEIAIMSRKLGVNPFEVIRAAATKPFGFMPFFPGPGLN